MRGGENNGRHERDEGDSPDQHRQPQAAPAQDQLSGAVQKSHAESVGDRRSGVPVGAAECDPGGDHLHVAGRANLRGGERNDGSGV